MVSHDAILILRYSRLPLGQVCWDVNQTWIGTLRKLVWGSCFRAQWKARVPQNKYGVSHEPRETSRHHPSHRPGVSSFIFLLGYNGNVCRYQTWHSSHVLTNNLTGAQSPDRKKTGKAYTLNESCSAPLFISYEKTGYLFIFLILFLLFFRARYHMPGRHLACHNT